MNDKISANILIIDDTPANLQILASMLDEQGYYVRPVNNGAMGVHAAQLSSPDLILLDIQMPGMDGFEACIQLKADKRTRDIPIIFISALNEISDKVKAFQLGGVDYITKPFQLEEVQARVNIQIELQRLRKQDLQLIEEQEQLIAELDAFAHTVAHDLKNPLSVISGLAELMTLPEVSLSEKDKVEILDNIIASVYKTNRIIDALLMLANVRKATDLDMEPVDMSMVITEVYGRLVLLFKEHNPEIISPESWPTGMGYAPWVEEIWTNYMSNALKYGGQSPRIELGADEPVNGMIRYWVKDNGPGMTDEEASKLFVPFTRLASAKKIEGHGLGLSIVQRIAKKMGGEVGVESVDGKGSLFYFTLAAAATA